jgi:hypothetical protein
MSKPVSLSATLFIRGLILAFGLALFLDQIGAGQLLLLANLEGPLVPRPVFWITLIAPAFFLWALWAASGILARLDRGDAFGPAMIRGLREIGAGLMLGAFAAIVVQPSLTHLIGNNFLEMRGVHFNITIENLTLVLVGLVFFLIARRGAMLKARLDGFV